MSGQCWAVSPATQVAGVSGADGIPWLLVITNGVPSLVARTPMAAGGPPHVVGVEGNVVVISQGFGLETYDVATGQAKPLGVDNPAQVTPPKPSPLPPSTPRALGQPNS